MEPTMASGPNENCDDVCAEKHLVCEPDYFKKINKCTTLRKHFKGCPGGCERSTGYDQPAFIAATSKCLWNGKDFYFSCSGAHKDTIRLCPCRKETNIIDSVS